MGKKLKGSALLWAVCALLIVVLVLTGILALNKTYATEEINIIAERRAGYFARSAVEIAADRISRGCLTENQDGDKTGADGKKINPEGDFKRFNVVKVTFHFDELASGETPPYAEIEKTSGDELRIVAHAVAGGIENTAVGIMKTYNGKDWVFAGYATE